MSEDPTIRGIIEFLGREVRRPAEKLATELIKRPLSPDVKLIEQTLRSAQSMGQLAGQLAPKEVTAAIDQLGSLANELRREGVDPAIGLADLLGDCLDGLDVLVATSAVPLPIELEEVRLALARARRPVLKLDLTLPAESATPATVGRLVRSLVEGAADLHERATDLDLLERAVVEAVKGSVERTRRYDFRKPVEIHARLQGDMLSLEIVDQGPGDLAASSQPESPPEWDVNLVRRAVDEVSYEPADQGGVLHLRRRLRSWRVRRASNQ